MSADAIKGLISNAVFLLALGVLYDTVFPSSRHDRKRTEVIAGMIMGFIGIAIMLNPWELSAGVVFDTRSILLSVGALFFGAIPSVIAGIMMVAYRFSMGGTGTLGGILSIVSALTVGCLWRRYRARWREAYGLLELYSLGVVVHVIMLMVLMLALPGDTARDVLSNTALPILIIFPVATGLLGMLLAQQEGRHTMALQIQSSEARLRQVIENMPMMLDAFDDQGRIIVWNSECERVTGYSSDEIIGNPKVLEVLYADEEMRDRVRSLISSKTEDYRGSETTLISKEGLPRTISWSNVSNRVRIPGWANWAVGIDVTDRNEALEAWRASEEKFRSVLEQSPYGISLLDRDGTILEWNQAIETVTGLVCDEVMGRSFWEVWADVRCAEVPGQEDSFETIRSEFQQRLSGSDLDWSDDVAVETVINAVGGVQRTVQWHLFPIRLRHGVLISVTMQDITERKRVTSQLSTSEEQYRLLAETASDFIVTHDLEGRITYANSVALGFFGFNENDVRGIHVREMLPPEQQVAMDARSDKRAGGARERFLYETEFIGPTGKHIPFEVVSSPIVRGGEIAGVLVVGRDLTQRKRAEERVHRLAQRLSLATESAHIGIWELDLKENSLLWDSQMYALYGVPPQDFGGVFEFWESLVHPEDRSRARAAVEDAIAGKTDLHMKFRILRPDREIRYVRAHGLVTRAEDGTPLRLTGVNWDITEREEVARALRASEARLRTLIEQAADAIFVTTFDGAVLDVNPAGCRLTGYSWDELQTMRLQDFMIITPDNPMHFEELKRDGNVRIERELMRRDGEHVHVEISAKMLSDGRVQGIVRDVTERKRAERALRESEKRLAHAQAVAHVGSWEFDLAQNHVEASEETRLIYGMGDGDWTITDVQSLPLPEYRDKLDQAMHNLIHHAQPYDVEFAIKRPSDGAIIDIHSRAEYDAQRNLIAGSIQDITARKRAEEQLRTSEFRLERAQAVARVGSWEVDLTTGQVSASQESRRLYGTGGVELTLDDIKKIPLPEYRDQLNRALNDLIEYGTPYDVEFKIKRKIDGTIIDIHSLAEYDPERQIVSGTIQDITERKRAEERLRQVMDELDQRVIERTAQLEAANDELKAFAYSVSHDLRAPLRAIDGFSRIVLEDYGPLLDAEGQRLLDVIRTNAQKMDRLIIDLLALSRVSQSDVHFQTVDMTALVKSVYEDIATPDDRNAFEFRVEPLIEVQGDRILLRHVWSNLLSNAIKYTLPNNEHRIEVKSFVENGQAIYSVSDTGVGFDPRYADKLFRVFQRLHTSKEFDGTGVGLAIVQRIVYRHGGRVWAESQPGQGATFYFAIPMRVRE